MNKLLPKETEFLFSVPVCFCPLSNKAHTVPIVQYFYLWMNMNLVMFGSMWMLSIELGS